jgi:redox-sensitive bicupin YhaK (pirin superfamily)
LPDDHEDRGAYLIQGAVTVAGELFEAGRMIIFRPGDAITLKAGVARRVALGGATLNGPWFLWWPFGTSSREKIEAGKLTSAGRDWPQERYHLPRG